MTAATTSSPEQTDLTRRLLAAVSRSFYLSLRILPSGMREPVSLAYLLARLTDTVADSSNLEPARRLHWLRQLGAAIAGDALADNATETDWSLLAQELEPGIEHPGERELVRRTSECLARRAALPAQDQHEIGRVLNDIVRGQSWDVEWFEAHAAPRVSRDAGELHVRCATDAAALHDYTYAVAGSVGRFWSRMCEQHTPGWHHRSVSAEQIEHDGEQLGRGLQLINILRDAPKDLKLGRCYLPITDPVSGLPELRGDLPSLSAQVREAAQPWFDICQDKLNDGGRYVAAVRHRRLRLAAALPWLLAEHTLDRLRRADPGIWQAGVKLTRREVKSLLRRATWRVLWHRPLDPLRPSRSAATSP